MYLYIVEDVECLTVHPCDCKTYYNYVGPNNEEKKQFRRYSYTIPSECGHLTLVHYKGDDSVVQQSDVGPRKPFVRTCPSVLRELEQMSLSPSVVYKKVSKSDCPLLHQPVLIPRNRKQVANMQAKLRQKIRLTHDALYNLHELSYVIDDFVHKIVTFPDLLVVCGLKCMLKQLNQLLTLKLTTFQLGDFYVSPLLLGTHCLRSLQPCRPSLSFTSESLRLLTMK